MDVVRFGRIDRLALFGGSWLTAALCRRLAGGSLRIKLFTGLRHLDGTVDKAGTTLRQVVDEIGIPYTLTADINREPALPEFLTDSTLGLALGAAWVFEPEAAARFDGRLLDFMGIPLPQYRGGAHYCWQILQRVKRGACHLQLIHGGPETHQKGEVIKSREYLFPEYARTPQDYFETSVRVETEFLLEFFEDVAQGREFTARPLQEAFSTYFPFLYTPRHGFIDWRWSADEIDRFICAFDDPYQGASSFVDGQRVFLKNCHAEYGDGTFHPFQAGLVYRKAPDALYIATRDATIVVRHVTDEKGRSVLEDIRLGQRLYTPQAVLDDALRFEAVYDARGIREAAR